MYALAAATTKRPWPTADYLQQAMWTLQDLMRSGFEAAALPNIFRTSLWHLPDELLETYREWAYVRRRPVAFVGFPLSLQDMILALLFVDGTRHRGDLGRQSFSVQDLWKLTASASWMLHTKTIVDPGPFDCASELLDRIRWLRVEFGIHHFLSMTQCLSHRRDLRQSRDWDPTLKQLSDCTATVFFAGNKS